MLEKFCSNEKEADLRQALDCEHPMTGEKMSFDAPSPEDMGELVRELGGS